MIRPVPLVLSLVAIFLLPEWIFGQSKHEPTTSSIIEAIARGEAREALSALEIRTSPRPFRRDGQ
jgi:hypothetical protein